MTHNDAAPPPTAPAPEKIGPGIFESIGWTIGYLLVQILVAIGLIGFMIVLAFEGLPDQPSAILEGFHQLSEADVDWLSVCLTGGATLGVLFLIVPAVFWRLRPAPRKTLGYHAPDGRQLVLLTGAVLPLAVLSDEVYRAASRWWEAVRDQLAQSWPAIKHFGNEDTISLVQHQAEITAYPLLLVIVGVGPAIGEELVFRGLIGRGLVNRLGVLWGVLLTSLLFALAHGTPAHALATIPLAVFLHLTYLATRTIWAPILVHFLNNALSITMLKFNLGANVEPSTLLLISAGIYAAAISIMLWQTRSDFGMSAPRLPEMRVSARRAADGSVMGSPAAPSWLTFFITTGALFFTWTYVSAAMIAS